MPTKKDIKKRSNNVFEKATGILLYKLKGKENIQCCQVAPHTRTSYEGQQYQLGHIAAAIYLNRPASSFKRVEHLCGIENCVLPSHLTIDGERLSTDSDGEILKKEIDLDAPDENGDIHGCSPLAWESFNDYQKSLARTGKYTQVEIGWMVAPKE